MDKDIPIPIPGITWPILRVIVPMSDESWTNMIDLLNKMKPAIVQDNTMLPVSPAGGAHVNRAL